MSALNRLTADRSRVDGRSVGRFCCQGVTLRVAGRRVVTRAPNTDHIIDNRTYSCFTPLKSSPQRRYGLTPIGRGDQALPPVGAVSVRAAFPLSSVKARISTPRRHKNVSLTPRVSLFAAEAGKAESALCTGAAPLGTLQTRRRRPCSSSCPDFSPQNAV